MMAGAGWLRSEGVAVHKQVGADSYAPVSAAELSCLQGSGPFIDVIILSK